MNNTSLQKFEHDLRFRSVYCSKEKNLLKNSNNQWILTNILYLLYGADPANKTIEEITRDIIYYEAIYRKLTDPQMDRKGHSPKQVITTPVSSAYYYRHENNNSFSVEAENDVDFNPYTIKLRIGTKNIHNKLLTLLEKELRANDDSDIESLLTHVINKMT